MVRVRVQLKYPRVTPDNPYFHLILHPRPIPFYPIYSILSYYSLSYPIIDPIIIIIYPRHIPSYPILSTPSYPILSIPSYPILSIPSYPPLGTTRGMCALLVAVVDLLEWIGSVDRMRMNRTACIPCMPDSAVGLLCCRCCSGMGVNSRWNENEEGCGCTMYCPPFHCRCHSVSRYNKNHRNASILCTPALPLLFWNGSGHVEVT